MITRTQEATEVHAIAGPCFSAQNLDAPTGGDVVIVVSSASTGEILGSLAPSPLESPAFPRIAPKGTLHCLDDVVLRRAMDTAESIDPDDPYQATLHLAALSGLVQSLWESAALADVLHQDILAELENGVRCALHNDVLTAAEVSAFREALTYLGQPHLVRKHVEVVRSCFLATNFPALSFLEDSQTNHGDPGD